MTNSLSLPTSKHSKQLRIRHVSPLLAPRLTLAVSIRDDETTYMCLELPRKSVYVHRVGNYASLVTICNNNVPTKDYYPNIEHTVRLLRKGKLEPPRSKTDMTAFDFIYSYK